MDFHIQFPFLNNREKLVLMMTSPVKEEFHPHKSEILEERARLGEHSEIIRKVEREIDNVINNRSSGFPTLMKKTEKKMKIFS